VAVRIVCTPCTGTPEQTARCGLRALTTAAQNKRLALEAPAALLEGTTIRSVVLSRGSNMNRSKGRCLTHYRLSPGASCETAPTVLQRYWRIALALERAPLRSSQGRIWPYMPTVSTASAKNLGLPASQSHTVRSRPRLGRHVLAPHSAARLAANARSGLVHRA
jgi:hypothetical protein